MEIPSAFNKVCGALHQDIFLFHESFEEAIRSCTGFVTAQEAKIAKIFIDELLHGSASDDQLEEIWNKSHSDWHVLEKGGVRYLLAMISNVLGEPVKTHND